MDLWLQLLRYRRRPRFGHWAARRVFSVSETPAQSAEAPVWFRAAHRARCAGRPEDRSAPPIPHGERRLIRPLSRPSRIKPRWPGVGKTGSFTNVNICLERRHLSPTEPHPAALHTLDFLLGAQSDKAAARRFFEKAIAHHGQPDSVTIDGSSANLEALHDINADDPITIRQVKYLNNIVEQDHRAIKRLPRPLLGFKDFRCARILLGGIELIDMIAKGQMQWCREGSNPSAAEQFYALAA